MGSWTNATPPTDTTHRTDRGDDARGRVVHPHHVNRVLERATYPPTEPALAPYVEHFWSVRWSRHGEPLETTEVIARPVCHLTFEDARSADGTPLTRHGVPMPAAVVTTVWTRRFVVRLEGEGRAFGVGFLPGALAALAGRALPPDHSLPASDVLSGAEALLPDILDEWDDDARQATVEAWLAPLCPTELDPDYELARWLVGRVRSDSAIVRVDQIAATAGVSVRGVQRLFRRYVGTTPKWVLTRSRLRDAAAALDDDPTADLGDVAARLGWYDQPHFVRDFRRYLGVTPGHYARDAARHA